MPVLRRRCPNDGLEFDLLLIAGELSALDHPDLDHLGCPTCGAEGVAIVAGFLAKDLGGDGGVGKDFPYYDRGLGCWVRDAAHRRYLAIHEPRLDDQKNDLGGGPRREQRLRPTDGDYDFTEQADIEQRASEASTAAFKAQEEEMRTGPNREAWGKLCEIMKDRRAIEEIWGE